jgi:phospholipid/cholesterol/gamma-HCH transport system ATP-binding protein
MIEVRHLQKSFGEQTVLDDINFRIETGESVVIIGRSGGGKSVLLKHLIGLLQPDSGEVLIDGENIVGMDERQLLRVRRKFGMVFQGAALFDSMTVAENVAFGLRRHEHLTEAEIAARVAKALDVVDLPGTEDKNPAELSGGMRKRVGLARAIIYRPQFMLYDEPTTGLDPIVSDSIDQLMMRVRDRLKVTTVVVTHDMRTARRVGQRVMMLHEKKIYASGTPEEIFASQDAVVRQFIDGVADAKENLFQTERFTRPAASSPRQP